jgi:cytochrome c2
MLKHLKIQSFGYIIILISITSILTPSFCFSQGITLSDNPLEGRRIFDKKECSKCHSIYGSGGSIAQDLGKDPNIKGIIEITAAMWNHNPEMTEEMKTQYFSRPTFTLSEIEKLYSFLYYLRYIQAEGNESKGKRLFREKQCILCHSPGGKTEDEGPDLRYVDYFISPLRLIQVIWDHGSEMEELMRKKNIKRPELSDYDLQDIASYLRQINKTPKSDLKLIATGNPADGRKIFLEKKCSLCHAIDENSESVGPDLRDADYNQNVSMIGAVLWNHAPKMWQMMKDNGINIPRLLDKEIADITAFIYFFKFTQVNGDAQKGRNVFSRKNCIKCHKLGNEGGEEGPSVAEMPVIDSPMKFSMVIWNQASKMEQIMNSENQPWPNFSNSEMADLYEFLKEITKSGKNEKEK